MKLMLSVDEASANSSLWEMQERLKELAMVVGLMEGRVCDCSRLLQTWNENSVEAVSVALFYRYSMVELVAVAVAVVACVTVMN